MKRVFLIATAVCMAGSVPLAARGDDGTIDANAAALYKKGKYAEAARAYAGALAKNPASPVLNFNAGAAHYKAGAHDAAAASFEKALLSGDKKLRAKSHYQLGNAQFKSAEALAQANPGNAAPLMRDSLENYRRALQLRPDYRNAKHNFEYVTKELRKLEEQLKQQPPEPSGGETKEQDQSGGNDPADVRQDQSPQTGERRDKADQQRQAGTAAQEQARSPEKRDDAAEHGRQESGAGAAEELSEAEARMLLDSARREERAGRLRDEGQGSVSEAFRDW